MTKVKILLIITIALLLSSPVLSSADERGQIFLTTLKVFYE
jgi:hypothetical protein